MFQPSSASRTFWLAVSSVNGGRGGRLNKGDVVEKFFTQLPIPGPEDYKIEIKVRKERTNKN